MDDLWDAVAKTADTPKDYWDRSGPELRWTQPHDELLSDALGNWKGDNSTLAIHMRDAREGKPMWDNGGSRIYRAQAEAILFELEHNAKPVPKLYRGDNRQPQGIRGWSTNRRTASSFAKLEGGRVWVLTPGSCKGIKISDYAGAGGLDQIEQEWIVDTPAGIAVTAVVDHFAKPLVDPNAEGMNIYVKPYVCAVCGQPIEHPHRGGGAWRHVKTAATRMDVGINMSRYFYYGTDEAGQARIVRDGEISDEGHVDVIISTRYEDMHDSPIVLTLLLSYSWLWEHLDPAVQEVFQDSKAFFNVMGTYSGELTVVAPIPAKAIQPTRKAGSFNASPNLGSVFTPFIQLQRGTSLSGWKVHIYCETTDDVLSALYRLRWVLDDDLGGDEAMGCKVATQAFFDLVKEPKWEHQRGKGVTLYLPRVATVDDDIDWIVRNMEGYRPRGEIKGDIDCGHGVWKRYELSEQIDQEIDIATEMHRYHDLYVKATLFNPSQMLTWEQTKPWNLSRYEAEAQMVDGWWGKQARSTESASWEQGYIRPTPEFYTYAEPVKRAIAYHEAGHAMLEAAGGLRSIEDPLGLIEIQGAKGLGYNAEEIIAEAYSVLWTDPEWFETAGAQQIREITIAAAKRAGFPVP